MNRAIISQRITSILAEIERLNNALYAMNTTDIQRYSNKGTYGTAGFMSRKELTEVLDLVPDIRKHSGITALPAIRTAPLISSPRCFFPLCLSAWFAMRTNIVPAGSFRFLFMYLVKSCVPVE